jgi:putative acetyltransferase
MPTRPAGRIAWRIAPGDLSDPAVIALLRTHIDRAHAEHGTPHTLDLDGLRAPGIRFWTVHVGDDLAGCGALKTLSAGHGEIKSMHTAEAWRGRGAGSAMLGHIIAVAHGEGLARLSLETGAWDYFRPAHALYARHGFVDCQPFGNYVPDPHSRFMTLDLAP